MPAYFVTGTDTDAGKTVVTGGLLRAFAEIGVEARAVKPVQTGCMERKGQDGASVLEAPDVLCWKEAGGKGEALEKFRAPCSPHLAARLENRKLDVRSLAGACRLAATKEGVTLLEGAGGLYVPLNAHENMLDLARELRFPMILVIGNRLGCINHALLSLDAMDREGLDVAGMILCRTVPPELTDAGTDTASEALILKENAQTLEAEGRKRGVPLLADIPHYPEFSRRSEETWAKLASILESAARHLVETYPSKRKGDGTLRVFDRRHLWHPYTSALDPLTAHEVTGTTGTRIILRDGRKIVDGMSSWWCAVHGYGHSRLVRAIQRQAARFSHVMFGGLTHEPAVELGRRLLKLLPAGLEHIFLADSGSVAVEVAIKMAIQIRHSSGQGEKRRLAALRGAYHGDTLGAMSLCDPVTGMHTLFKGVLPEQLFVERPSCRFDGGYDRTAFAAMEETLREHSRELTAVIVEPVVQGAGGMWFYHPGYLRDLRELCDELDILLIADEIATGFGRTGRMFACEWAGISPDIMCVGKALAGGMMTLSAVAASHRVAAEISSADAAHGNGVFMHGPTFMGNPLACAAACASLDELVMSPWSERVESLERWLKQGLISCRTMAGVADVRVLGAIGVVEMEKNVDVEAWQAFFLQCGVWIRPFARTVYIMPPFVSRQDDISRLCLAVRMAVSSAARNGGIPHLADAVSMAEKV